MSQNSFSTTSRTSWFQRLGASLSGLVFGLVLILIGIALLGWNEARSVAAIRTADEGGRQVVAAQTGRVDPALNGRLVHLSGQATATSPIADPETGVSIGGLRLVRTVEHYQWVETSRSETRTRLGGGQETVTTYDYARDWSPRPVASADFKQPEGHANPSPVLADADHPATDARLGVYRLDREMVGRLPAATPVNPTQADATNLSSRLGRPVVVTGDVLYVGANPAAPQVGDARVRYSVAPFGPVSVMARQDGDRLSPYRARHGSVFEVRTGLLDAAAMVRQVKADNQVMSWLLRLAGFVAVAAGAGMVLNPLRVLADVLPLAGSIVGVGTGLVSLVFAVAVSGVVIALSWLAVRPVVAVLCLAIVGAAVVAAIVLKRRGRPQAVAIS